MLHEKLGLMHLGKGLGKLVIELNGPSRFSFLWNSSKLNQIHQNMLSSAYTQLMKWNIKIHPRFFQAIPE